MDEKNLTKYIFNNFFNDSSSESDGNSVSSTSSSSADDLPEDDLETLYTVLLGASRDSCGKITYNPRPSVSNYVERVVPSYLTEEFKTNFRMLPSTFEFVLSLIGPAITGPATYDSRRTLDAEKQLKLALCYMVTPVSYRSLCEMFRVGCATVVRALRRVIYALHCLASQWITWPSTSDQAAAISRDFEAQCGFPGVIGAVAGIQVNILAPKGETSTADHKCDSSVHLQAVCDAHHIFTYCVAENLGSIYDSCAQETLPLVSYLENPDVYFPGDSHLIGDDAYGIHCHLQVPFAVVDDLTEARRTYNDRLLSGTAAVERAFGLLIGRFKSLLDKLQFSDKKRVPVFIIACFVLHNICMHKNDILEEKYYVVPTLCHIPFYDDASAKLLGEQKRERIMNILSLKHEPE